MSETLKLQRNASIYTKRRQMRKAATRTAQVRVNCFGARTDRAGKDNAGSQGWAGARGGKKKGRAKDRMKQTEVRGEVREEGGREGEREKRGEKEKRERERFVQKVTSKIEETKLGNLLKLG